MEDRQTWGDTLETRGPSIICGDFNAHHVSCDEYAQGILRVVELRNWVEENEMVVLNDGNQQELPGSNKGAVYVLLTSPSSTQRLQTASAGNHTTT